ncbi:cadherin-like domain-containing protein, partial [Algibacillus agarilyticus]|uniref:cadherin-like domain-containing protein n=1 Tax=Algibacillus agarilyticus TaxID=2234133 RepID=UPI0013008B0A
MNKYVLNSVVTAMLPLGLAQGHIQTDSYLNVIDVNGYKATPNSVQNQLSLTLSSEPIANMGAVDSKRSASFSDEHVSFSPLMTPQAAEPITDIELLSSDASLANTATGYQLIDRSIELQQAILANELIIIDEAVPQKHLFYQQLKPGVDVVELKSNKNGLEQLQNVLSQYTNLAAIHIVSHASAGVLKLGNSEITEALLKAEITTLAQLDNAMIDGGDVLLYGCDLASSKQGENFLELIASVANVDVVASNNPTGNKEQGGDWQLEVARGNIESEPLFNSVALKDFSGVLAVTQRTLRSLYDAKGGQYNVASITSVDNNFIYTDTSGGVIGLYASGSGANLYVKGPSPGLNKFYRSFQIATDGTNAATFEMHAIELQAGFEGACIGTEQTVNVAIKGYYANDSLAGTSTLSVTSQAAFCAYDVDSFDVSSTFGAGKDLKKLIITFDGSAPSDKYITVASFSVDQIKAPAANSAPTISTNTGVSLTESDVAVISTVELQGSDDSDAATALTYTLTTEPTNGVLFIDDDDDGLIDASSHLVGSGDTWTGTNLANSTTNRLKYLHYGTDTTSDSFTFSVTDSAAASLTGQTFNLTIADAADSSVTLAQGDVVITKIDGENDLFDFIPLVDLPVGTVLKFTDKGWGESDAFTTALSGEGFITWTLTSAVSAGELIRVTMAGNSSVTFTKVATSTDITSEITHTGYYASGLMGTSEQIFIFQGTESNPFFIFGINSSSETTAVDGDGWSTDAASIGTTTGNKSEKPSGTGSQNALTSFIAFNTTNGGHLNIRAYNGSVTATDKTSWLARFVDNSNWSGDDDAITGSVTTDISLVSNDAPTVSNTPSTLTVTEDTASDLTLAATTFADTDGDTLSITLTNSAGTFSTPVDGANVTESLSGDAVTLVGTAANLNTYLDTASNLQYTPGLNANGADYATITISGTDGTASLTSTPSIIIDVSAENDAPTISGTPSTLTVTEDTESNLTLGAVAVADVDSSDTLTILVSNSAGTFSTPVDGANVVESLSGDIVTLVGTADNINTYLDTATNLKYTPALNANGASQATLTITGNDASSANLTTSPTILLDITAIDDAPTASSVAFSGSLEEDETLTGTYSYSDVDSDAESGSTFKWYRSSDSGGTGKAAISGATSSTYVLVSADIGNFISFEVTPVNTNSSGIATESAINTTAVTAANDAPTITSAPATLTVTEDTESNLTLGTAVLADTDNNTITLSVSNSSGTFSTPIDDANVVESIASDIVTLVGTAANLNTYLDTATNLKYTPALNVSGTNQATITISGSDGIEALTSSPEIIIDVIGENDSPTITTNTGKSLNESDVVVISISELLGSDVEDAATDLTYTLTTEPSNGVLFIDDDNDGLIDASSHLVETGDTWTGANLANSTTNRLKYLHYGTDTTSDSFTFSVTDSAAASLTGQTFNLTIADVADSTVTLAQGDVVITKLDTDNDFFDFVPLVDLPLGTVLKFTDKGWGSSNAFTTALSGEGYITWTLASAVSAGELIRVAMDGNSSVTFTKVATSTDITNEITHTGYYASGLMGSSEQIFIFQGTETNPFFIFGINSSSESSALAGDGWSSATETIGLSTGSKSEKPDGTGSQNALTSFIAFNTTNGGHLDIRGYNDDITAASRAAWLTRFSDNSKWSGNDDTLTGAVTTDISILANSAPTISSTPDTLTVSENTESNLALADVVLADSDNDSLTLTLTNSAGTFSTPVDGANVTEVLSGDAITLVGTAANLNTYLDTASNIKYTPVTDAIGTDQATITISGSDGITAFTSSPIVSIDITTPNNAPANTTPNLTGTEDTTLSITSGLSVSDADSDDTATLIISSTSGAFNFTATDNLTPTANNSSSVTLTGDGTGDIAALNTALTNLEYVPATNTNGSLQYTMSLYDGTTSDVDIGTISLNASNDAPTISGAPSGVTVQEDTESNLTLGAIALADVDSGDTLTILASNSSGTFTSPVDQANVVESLANDTVTLVGTADNINTYLDTVTNLKYTPSANASGTNQATITISGSDASAEALVSTTSVTIDITAANDAPTVAVNSTTTVNEGATVTLMASSLSATDVDDSDVTYTVSTIPTNGTLYLNSSALANSGTFTQANIASGIVTYAHSGSETTSDSFVFTVEDGNEDSSTPSNQTHSISITAVNDSPVLATNSAATVVEGNSIAITGSQLNTTDGDNTASEITYTLSTAPNEGSLVLNSTTTLTASDTFTQANVDASDVVYHHSGGEASSDSFNFAVSDGTTLSVSDTFSVNVTAVNDAPAISGAPDTLTVTEDVASGLSLSALTLTDPDTTTATLTFSVGAGTLSATAGTGVTTGIINSQTITMVGSPAALTTHLDTASNLQFTSVSNSVTATSLVVSASDGTTDTGNTVTSTISITPVNDAPILDLNGNGTGIDSDETITFTEGDVSLNIASSASVTEVDAGDLITAITVALTNDQDGTSEGLYVSAAAQNALSGISGASDISGDDTITITGATASALEVGTLLKTITYQNASTNPSTTQRVITVSVNDGDDTTTSTVSLAVASLTAATATGVLFNTSSGSNLTPAITFGSEDETLTVTNASHFAGSTFSGGGGNDTLVVTATGDVNVGAATSISLTAGTLQTAGGGDTTITLNTDDGLDDFTTYTGQASHQDILKYSAISGTDLSGVTFTNWDAIQNDLVAHSVTGATVTTTISASLLGSVPSILGDASTDVLNIAAGSLDLTNNTFSSIDLLQLTGSSDATLTLNASVLSGISSFDVSSAATATIQSDSNLDVTSNTLTSADVIKTTSSSGASIAVTSSQFNELTSIVGGSGTDTLVVSGAGSLSVTPSISAIEELNFTDDTAGAQTLTVAAETANNLTLSAMSTDVFKVEASSGAQTIYADDNGGSIDVGAGADTVRVNTGVHTVTLGEGDDTLVGTVTELNGDSIADLSAGDKIKVLSKTFTSSNVSFSSASTLLIDTEAAGFSSASVTLNLTDSSGSTLTATASNDGTDTTITIGLENRTPTITNTPSSITVNEDISSNVDLSDLILADADTGDTITLTLSSSGKGSLSASSTVSAVAVSGSPSSSVTLTGTPTELNSYFDTASHVTYTTASNDNSGTNLILTPHDGTVAGTAQTISLAVTAINDAPTISTNGLTSVNEDSAYNYTISASDIDSSSLTYSATTKPDWLTLTGRVLSGTPTNDNVGSHAVVLNVSDGTASVDQSFSVTVTNTNDAPTITSSGITSATEDSAYSYTLAASDVDTGDTLTYTATTKPDWLTLTNNVLSGTPTNDNVGSHA